MNTPATHLDYQFAHEHQMLAAERRATAPLPPLASTRGLLDVVGASITRTARSIALRVVDRTVATTIDVPAAAGATDAELARLDHRPERGSAAQAYRDAAWMVQAGTPLYR